MNKSQTYQHFLVVEDTYGKRLVKLQSETCSIGRDPRNTIVLDSQKVSRFHATLLRITIPKTNSQLFRIIDGNLQGIRSKNGFEVNGNVCFSYDLQDGDKISFCDDIIATYNVVTKQDKSGFYSDNAEAATCIIESANSKPRRTTNSSNTEELSAAERQELIQKSLERLASFPELFSNPILEIDLEGNITYLNPAAIKYFPDIKKHKLEHPILAGIIPLLKSSRKNFVVREVVVGKQIFEQSIHLISTSKLVRSYVSNITQRKRAEIALKKARKELEKRVEERTRELATNNMVLKAEIAERERVETEIRLLQNIIQSASEAPNSVVAINKTLIKVCENIGWVYGEAWIGDRHKQEFTLSPAYYSKSSKLSSFRKNRQVSYTIGIPQKIWQTRQPEWIEDVSATAETVFSRNTFAREITVKAALVVPIIADKEIIAVFVFFDLAARPKNEGTIRLIESVASQLGSILQRKRAQDALHSSMSTNRALLNTIPDWMFRISEYGIIINFKAPKSNNEVPLLVKNNFIGKRLDEILPSIVADNMLDSIIQALETQELQLCEYQLTTNGETKYYEARIAINNEKEKEMMAIVRDITEKKQIEQDIRDALEKQKNLNELKNRFVSMASHEFRTPLTSIFSSAELLEHYSHKWSEERKLNHLHRIQNSVNHMTALLNDVLLLGKADAGKLELKSAKIDLPKFCQELVEEIQLTAETHKIVFQVNSSFRFEAGSEIQEAELLQGHSATYLDEKLLRHILYNLLSNAIKYSPDSDRVNFDLFCEPRQAILRIQDFGIGVPPAEQERLFDSFHRCDNVGSIPGTGLGLPIVKRAVDLHGGKISMESQVGVGTTFTVTLPYLSHS